MDAKGASHKQTFPPVYNHPLQDAVKRGELEQFQISHDLNAACAKAIDAALTKHFDRNTYDLNTEAASREVVEKFGFDRTMAVLANTVRHCSFDGRFSNSSREWARTIPRLDSKDHDCLVSVNAGWTDLFIGQVWYDHLMTQPLQSAEIKAEAENVLKQFQAMPEPNSPDRTKFMVKISQEFNDRAKPEDFVSMLKMLPFSSPTLTTLPSKRGFFAVISSNENRNQYLRKPSIRAKLAVKPVPGDKPAAKLKDREVR